MTSAAPVISAIVVSYNTRAMTLDCLRDLYADLGDTPAEVFVVDNASTDGSAGTIREQFPRTIVIDNTTNAGFGAANNQAIRRATGTYLLLLNSDAMVKAGAIGALVEQMRSDGRIAVVGPRLLNADGSLQASCYKFPGPARSIFENTLLTAAFPNHRVVGDYRAWNHDAARGVELAIGACLLVRRVAVDEIGLFDEDFFLYAEETDWLYRFHRAGWKIWFTARRRGGPPVWRERPATAGPGIRRIPPGPGAVRPKAPRPPRAGRLPGGEDHRQRDAAGGVLGPRGRAAVGASERSGRNRPVGANPGVQPRRARPRAAGIGVTNRAK